MSCLISAPATGCGKTTLSLLISCWAYSKGLRIQTFKVGPDYLDQQQLSSIGHPICRNLDIFLSGEEWVKKTFNTYSTKFDLTLIEGAMGLYEGLGSTHYSSTAHVAKILGVPIIFIINAKGQVASLLALLKGFSNLDKGISIRGIVFNNVNSERHKRLIQEVFQDQPFEILGFLPSDEKILLRRGNLGLISPLEGERQINIDYFAEFAEKNLNMPLFLKFLLSFKRNTIEPRKAKFLRNDSNKPIAIAEDKIFHFQYPETKEFLNEIGIPLISWNIYKDEEIPEEASSVIIPGGFPEKYAQHISASQKSLNSLRKFYRKGFIYAECGGMMILGDEIVDVNGIPHKMAGILPFKAKKGKLSIGYRYIKGISDYNRLKENQHFKGHEFHYWQLDRDASNFDNNLNSDYKFYNPWEVKSWGTKYRKEGFSNKYLHASWIHLHFPSNREATNKFLIKI